MSDVLYQIKNPGELPLPKPLVWFMYLMFSIPLLMIPMTLTEIPENPWLLVAYPFCFLPLGIMWLLKRLMGRYGITVGQDGRLEVMLPFKTDRFAPGTLKRVALHQTRMHMSGRVTTRTFLQLIGAQDKLLTHFDVAAFTQADVEGLLGALRQLDPQLPISHTQ
ncbi:hypothetical protein C7S18_20655 [Ahniella affigens]|uniref:DUF304 domain-containing protein n=1 Tax=Ahniella affigens TaxID=2021234 RepID=A0A2P1PX52_9GAMM|nr:hypothetical protein [Ahniella affigens]AVP99431.1 hypothetical protein C7S18_20655 [Ahniella affigens]